eukprot:Sspe_Gene.20242::Locus_7428_Transcript_1_6_Confidence_0.250_Length_1398::g.20242::m.20242
MRVRRLPPVSLNHLLALLLLVLVRVAHALVPALLEVLDVLGARFYTSGRPPGTGARGSSRSGTTFSRSFFSSGDSPGVSSSSRAIPSSSSWNSAMCISFSSLPLFYLFYSSLPLSVSLSLSL